MIGLRYYGDTRAVDRLDDDEMVRVIALDRLGRLEER